MAKTVNATKPTRTIDSTIATFAIHTSQTTYNRSGLLLSLRNTVPLQEPPRLERKPSIS